MKRHPGSCHQGKCDLIVAIYGDHAVYGASDNERADSPRFWQQLLSDGEPFALFHAHDVPEEIASDLIAQGTQEQAFHDGYTAFHAVQRYLRPIPFWVSHEYDEHAGPHDPLGSREYEDNPRHAIRRRPQRQEPKVDWATDEETAAALRALGFLLPRYRDERAGPHGERSIPSNVSVDMFRTPRGDRFQITVVEDPWARGVGARGGSRMFTYESALLPDELVGAFRAIRRQYPDMPPSEEDEQTIERESIARERQYNYDDNPLPARALKRAAELRMGHPMPSGKHRYIWYWKGGGYNTAMASSPREALRIAKKMGEPPPRRPGGYSRTVALIPDETSVRRAGPHEYLSQGELRSPYARSPPTASR